MRRSGNRIHGHPRRQHETRCTASPPALAGDDRAVLPGRGSASAQSPARINLYRYVLDVDVPESAALIALDATSSHVLRGSAPKPIMATVFHAANGPAGSSTGGAVDIVPYFLLGGGIRPLDSYRANSIRGRLLRVVTKTSLSLAAISDPANSGSLRGSVGLRITFHDPHDPVLNSKLPESVDSALRAHQIEETDPTVEDITDRGSRPEPGPRDGAPSHAGPR